MKAEIVSIGTEILLGEIVDTNASYLASQLPTLGIDLYWMCQVGDNQGRVVEALRRALGRSDLILTTGGLGPTEDDITRESIAEALGEKLSVDPALEQELREFFRKRNINMPPRNIKQATLILSAKAIINPRGTAPGWWVEKEGKIIVAMPGPPREMQRMWEKEVLPRLKERTTGAVIVSRTIKTFAVAEALIDEMVSPLLAGQNPTIGTYAKPDGIHLRLTAKAETEEKARELIIPVEERLRAILGESVWGVDDEALEMVIGSLLQKRGLTLATMESCTGGLLASTITDAPGSSAYFKGSIVAYSNEAKITYGVDPALISAHGAVSAPVAEAMARVARERFGVSVGLGVTGVAGPTELEGKPVGTVYTGLALGSETKSFHNTHPPQRPEVKRRAALGALFHLLRLLRAK